MIEFFYDEDRDIFWVESENEYQQILTGDSYPRFKQLLLNDSLDKWNHKDRDNDIIVRNGDVMQLSIGMIRGNKGDIVYLDTFVCTYQELKEAVLVYEMRQGLC